MLYSAHTSFCSSSLINPSSFLITTYGLGSPIAEHVITTCLLSAVHSYSSVSMCAGMGGRSTGGQNKGSHIYCSVEILRITILRINTLWRPGLSRTNLQCTACYCTRPNSLPHRDLRKRYCSWDRPWSDYGFHRHIPCCTPSTHSTRCRRWMELGWSYWGGCLAFRGSWWIRAKIWGGHNHITSSEIVQSFCWVKTNRVAFLGRA